MLLQGIETGAAVQFFTLIEGPGQKLGQMILLFPDKRLEGNIIDASFTEKVVAESQKQGNLMPCVLNIFYKQAEYKVFWNVAGQEHYRAIILGGGHISQPLVQILAILGYEITVVDDRREFASPERFPGAKQVLCDNFGKVLQEIQADEQTAVIIVTRGHQYDLDCLRSVIGTQAGYIGMIGSRRKVQATLQLLVGEGISPEILARVRAPIGLDLGGQSPEEIGVSIAAEVVATFKGGNYLPLSYHRKAVQHG